MIFILNCHGTKKSNLLNTAVVFSQREALENASLLLPTLAAQ